MGHVYPIFRKVIRKNRTEKKIPEMTLNVPHVPPRSFHHPVATHSDVQIPKTRITNTPQLRTISLGFTFSEIPFVKISTLVKSTSPDFSPNNFTGNFPQIFHKKFSDKTPVCDFPKMPHRTFRQIPASNLHLM